MINRFKLLFLLLILILLAVVFIQNQQPLSLKLLCPDVNTSCLYRTGELPLAIWMGVFIAGGIFTSLLWQLLNRFSYSSTKQKNYATDVLYDSGENLTTKRSRDSNRYPNVARSRSSQISESSASDWENISSGEDWQTQQPPKSEVENSQPATSTSSEYEIRREPENVTVSGSTYSYKFKEASSQEPQKSNAPNLNKESNLDEENNDEEWI